MRCSGMGRVNFWAVYRGSSLAYGGAIVPINAIADLTHDNNSLRWCMDVTRSDKSVILLSSHSNLSSAY